MKELSEVVNITILDWVTKFDDPNIEKIIEQYYHGDPSIMKDEEKFNEFMEEQLHDNDDTWWFYNPDKMFKIFGNCVISVVGGETYCTG